MTLLVPAPHPVALTSDSTSPRKRGEEGALAADLRAGIPGLRGTLQAGAPTAPLSWFRTGGPAEVLFTPADEEDLAAFLAGCPAEVPVLVVGLGSNLLVRDGGIRGVVIRLGKALGDMAVEGPLRIRAGAGAPDVKVARLAAESGIDGLTFLRGIPGAIGGALRMNGGAYGGETADVLVEARALDRQGRTHVLSKADMAFTYRHCGAPEGYIFTEAVFEGRPGDSEAILAAMNAITEARSASQPVNTRTGGSTFKNPPGHKAWELVDRAGCRGLRIGDAQVSELHCNFLINHGGATAADIENLGEEVRRRVREASGVALEWEIKRVGEPPAA
jgi:UDP-N-acetylmuramate dehydrogenase